jgi:uncharacterized protein
MIPPETVPGKRQPLPLIPRLLVRLVSLVCRAPALVLTLTAASLVVSVHAACTRLEYHTQRDQMINPDKDCQQRWREYLREFGDDEDMVVVVRSKGPEARSRMTAALEALAGRIRQDTAHFDRLFYKVDLRHLRNRALLFLTPEQIRQIQENLGRMRLLLTHRLAWRMFSLHGLLDEGTRRLARMSPGKPLSEDDAQFLGQLLAVVRSSGLALEDPKTYHSPWSSLAGHRDSRIPEGSGTATSARELLEQPQFFFSGDGALAFLLVRPAGTRDALVGPHESVRALRDLLSEVRPEFTDLELGLTGLPVLETDEMIASQSDTTLASWLALAGVALLYLVVFRSFRLPLLTVCTLVVGTLWALGWLTLTVGHLNLLSATFAVMLIGMGDYGVLWVTRYQQERASGGEVRESLLTTTAAIGPSILTAAATTSMAFYAAMFADFMAVAELGWVAGSGVLFCALACFTVLPALILLVDRRKESIPSETPPAVLPFTPAPGAWLPGLARRPRWVVGVGLGLMLVLGVFGFRVHYDHNLLNLQASDLDSVRWQRTLIQHTAGASWHSLSYTDTPEEALALKARFEKLPSVSHVVEVASLVPPDQESKLAQMRDIQTRLQRLPPLGETVIPAFPSTPETVQQDIERLVGEDPWAQGAQTRGGLLRPLLDVTGTPDALLLSLEEELSGLRDRLGKLPLAMAQSRLRDLEQRLATDLAADLHRLRGVATPVPIRLADLPPDLRERYVSKNGKWLLRVFGKGNLWEFTELARFVAAVKTVDQKATGKPFTTLEGLRSLRQGFLWAGVYALAAIVVVLFLDFRSPARVLLALAPLAVGLSLALGVMGLLNMPLNPANVIALPLVLGVGVDNGVHVLHDYLSRRQRRGKPYRLGKSTGQGILVAALTTVLGFGTLMLSSHRGLAGLGFILALGVSCCMLAALVVLPAALSLWGKQPDEQTQPRKEVALPEPALRQAA